jgi:hypothetical protein
MSLTNAGEDWLLGLFRNNGPFYLGLFTEVPGEEGGGSEITAGGYTRQEVVFGSPSDGKLSNSEAIEFPTATANWGSAVACGLFDSLSGGTLRWFGEITEPKELYAGDIYRVDIGNLNITMD